MRRYYIIILLAAIASPASAQDFGLSFSYFIPKNGYVSTPVSPFSIRGLGVNLTKFVSLETGASLYRMSGLNVVDMPFQTKDPIVGPNFTILVPLELVFGIQGRNVSFDVKGGAFGFVPFANRIDYGNFDRAIRAYEAWQVANADADFKSSPGYGWMAGAELTLYVTRQWGLTLETNYLAGNAKFPISGSYAGIDSNGDFLTEAFDYTDARIDLTGLEFSIGVIVTSGGGMSKPKRRR